MFLSRNYCPSLPCWCLTPRGCTPSKVSIATIIPLTENLPKFLMLMECLQPVRDLYHERGAQSDVGETLLESRGETQGFFLQCFWLSHYLQIDTLDPAPDRSARASGQVFQDFFSLIKWPNGPLRHISVFYHYA